MRRIRRQGLSAIARAYLSKRRNAALAKFAAGTLDATAFWKSARATKTMKGVLDVLHAMAGPLERCMYCMDSHGSDIDHFRPKATYTRRIFNWNNMVLSCTECGRIKGNDFPVSGRAVLLIDPTRDRPWDCLDFDPLTGNVVARFDAVSATYSARGTATVNLLRFDRRGALQAGRKQSFARTTKVVRRYLANPDGDYAALWERLVESDGFGLLGWVFAGTGSSISPFDSLKSDHLGAWDYCAAEQATFG